ncbi:hypothetical protein [Arthrobacter sp. SLBN-53]|uniref:hypothetical protein n=1 Tax=Arthrobacter sp. SLBN-53 TaxID=2768412 RepID=UPI001170C14C|nr:hypothetical protein [Arthrobacter sp. SLBN-53]TQK28731.1 hypothetical protein FBY28_1719 [Arthrobacter sp. SLBN-53]
MVRRRDTMLWTRNAHAVIAAMHTLVRLLTAVPAVATVVALAFLRPSAPQGTHHV